jgi:TolB protein
MGKQHIYEVFVDGSGLKKVSSDTMNQWWSAWSPNGQEILFHSSDIGNRNIWITKTTGEASRQITKSNSLDFCAVWSPSGEELAFTSTRSGNAEIWIISLQGGIPQQITSAIGWKQMLCWCEDGLYYEHFKGYKRKIIHRTHINALQFEHKFYYQQ